MTKITLAHSELTNTIYAIIGKEKIDITEQAIAEVKAIKALEQEPSEDAISRKWLKTSIHNFYYGLKHTPTEEDIQAYIDVAPPVQPKYNTSEWCHDCKEYDHEKHCCPRFNRVIHNAVEEVKKPKVGHWIDIMVGDMQAQACDQCKTFYPLAYTGGGHRFCPNCGCLMREGNDNGNE